MFPKYGQIFSKHCAGAATIDAVTTAIHNALSEFWLKFQTEYSTAKFMFNGNSITGSVTTPVTGQISRF